MARPEAYNQDLQEQYLDSLALINKAGYMSEYVWSYFIKHQQQDIPVGLNISEFEMWQKVNIPNHVPQTSVSVELSQSACKNT